MHEEPVQDDPAEARVVWWWEWSIVYVLNLIILGYIGITLMYDRGWMGMGCGVIVCWAIGLGVGAWPGHMRTSLVNGMAAVGFTQVIPIVHVTFAVMAVGCLVATTPLARLKPRGVELTGRQVLAEASGFVLTVTTLLPLMAFATGVGYVRGWRKGQHPTERDRGEME